MKVARNAFIEINNLFADTNHPGSVSPEQLERIAFKYRVRNVFKKFRRDFERLYESYLRHCLIDKRLDETEISELRHLKQLLMLNEMTVQPMHDKACQEIYDQTIKAAIADNRLSPEEREVLRRVESDLRLPEHIATDLFKKNSVQLLNDYVTKAIADQRLSPDEEAEINAIAESLGVNVSYDAKTKIALDKYRLFWLVENGQIPETDTGIKLQSGEKGYFFTHADLYEKRTVARRIRYGGPTARIRIMKGIYYSAGDIGVQKVTEDITQKQDTGKLILTSKRLLFMGNRKNTVIRLNKIVDLTPYSNGIEVAKETGRNPIYMFDENTDIFAFILSKAIDEAA